MHRELPALILTLQEIYEESGDAEALGVQLTYGGVAVNSLPWRDLESVSVS